MKIMIHTMLELKQVLGQKRTEIDLPHGSTMDDLISYMKNRWGEKLSSHLLDPATGAMVPHLRVMVNGQAIHYLQGMATPLNEGDEVLIIPPASGG